MSFEVIGKCSICGKSTIISSYSKEFGDYHFHLCYECSCGNKYYSAVLYVDPLDEEDSKSFESTKKAILSLESKIGEPEEPLYLTCKKVLEAQRNKKMEVARNIIFRLADHIKSWEYGDNVQITIKEEGNLKGEYHIAWEKNLD